MRGLKTHEIVEACHLAECIGARVDMQAGILESTAERLARVSGALDCVVGGYPVTGEELETVL